MIQGGGRRGGGGGSHTKVIGVIVVHVPFRG